RETLFIPPNASDGDWRCRSCWNLIYASQRYGRRHPLRRVLTSRKLATRVREQARRGGGDAKGKRGRGAQCKSAAKGAGTKARELQDHREAEQARDARRRDAQSEVRALLEADAAENQIYLDAIKAGDLSPRSVRGQAALMLRRIARRYAATR